MEVLSGSSQGMSTAPVPGLWHQAATAFEVMFRDSRPILGFIDRYATLYYSMVVFKFGQ